MSILEKLLAMAPSRETRQRVIDVDDDGFSVSLDGSDASRVDWASVKEIAAFKRDLFAYDEICLGFRCGSDDRFWWVGEEDVGYKALRAEVEKRFDGLLENWWSTVAFPAYEENWTTIWKRATIE